MLNESELVKILRGCFPEDQKAIFVVEDFGKRTKLFSGLRSEIEKVPLNYLLNLANATPERRIKEEPMDTKEFKKGSIIICEKESNLNAEYSSALKEAKVLKFLSGKTDVVPWVFGYKANGKVSVLMEYLSDFNLGRFLSEPSTEEAHDILYAVSKGGQAGATKNRLKKILHEDKKNISAIKLTRYLNELLDLGLVSEQEEGDGRTKKFYVTGDFLAKFDSDASRKAGSLQRKDQDESRRWTLLKGGLDASFELRGAAKPYLSELTTLAGLAPFYDDEELKRTKDKNTWSWRIAKYTAYYMLERFLTTCSPKTIDSQDFSAEREAAIPKLVENLRLLDSLEDSFLTNDNYHFNFMRREKVTDPKKLLDPLNKESRGNKLVVIDAYHACYGPWILDDADYLFYSQAALGIKDNVTQALTDIVLAEGKSRFNSQLPNEGGRDLMRKLCVLKGIRYFIANAQRLVNKGKPSSDYEKEKLNGLNKKYAAFIEDSFKSKVLPEEVGSFFRKYLLDKL